MLSRLGQFQPPFCQMPLASELPLREEQVDVTYSSKLFEARAMLQKHDSTRVWHETQAAQDCASVCLGAATLVLRTSGSAAALEARIAGTLCAILCLFTLGAGACPCTLTG